jgi:hypothetical protein
MKKFNASGDLYFYLFHFLILMKRKKKNYWEEVDIMKKRGKNYGHRYDRFGFFLNSNERAN